MKLFLIYALISHIVFFTITLTVDKHRKKQEPPSRAVSTNTLRTNKGETNVRK